MRAPPGGCGRGRSGVAACVGVERACACVAGGGRVRVCELAGGDRRRIGCGGFGCGLMRVWKVGGKLAGSWWAVEAGELVLLLDEASRQGEPEPAAGAASRRGGRLLAVCGLGRVGLV